MRSAAGSSRVVEDGEIDRARGQRGKGCGCSKDDSGAGTEDAAQRALSEGETECVVACVYESEAAERGMGCGELVGRVGCGCWCGAGKKMGLVREDGRFGRGKLGGWKTT